MAVFYLLRVSVVNRNSKMVFTFGCGGDRLAEFDAPLSGGDGGAQGAPANSGSSVQPEIACEDADQISERFCRTREMRPRIRVCVGIVLRLERSAAIKNKIQSIP